MASTLTAGNDGATGRGFSDGSLGAAFGTMSPATLAGVTVNSLFTDPTYFPGQIALFTPPGTASSLSSVDLKINGSTFSNAGQTDYGSFVQTVFTSGGFTFGNGVGYTIDSVGGAPASPNITSPSTVPNLIGTKLAHTVTADKTIASTAITGGADAAEFEINGTAGLRFAGDANSDTAGSYVVEVTITDTDGLTASQTITVPVKYILYVGGKTWSRAGATTTTNVSLTDLTGGIASAPAEGDYVIVQQGIGSNADRAVATTSGYTEWADTYSNGTTYDANLGVDAKFMTSTPDTTVTIGSSGSANDAQAARIMVFRGVDQTNPMDVAVVTATGTGTGKPDPGAITPITTGAVGVFSGAQAAATAAALTSSDLTAFASVNQADTNDIAVAAGYIEWSGSGAINPAAFGGGSSNSANSWAAVSLALRPAYTTGGGPVSITPTSASHTHTASSPSLSAKSSVTPNSAAHSQTATSPDLASHATIIPDGASHAHSATSPTLTAQSSVAPDDAAHATTSTSPTVSVPVAISPDSAVSAHTSSSPTIAAKSTIAPDDSAHAHTASSPTVTTANSVAPDNAAHAQTASEQTIAAASSVSVDDTAHGHSASSPSLTAQSSVQPDDAAHGHTASEPSLSAASTVAPDDAYHASSATSPTVSTGGSVAVDSTAHDQTATSPTIAAQSSVSVNSAAHALTSTSPTISAASSVQPGDASHAQAATSPTIAAKASLSVDSAAHGQEASSPTLSGSLAIIPASAVHAHIAGQPTIAWHGMIAANDAAHDTASTSPSIAARSSISPDSASHGQAATSPLLASASSIAVASAFHDHLASSPTIRITLPSSDRRAAGSLRPRTTATTEPSRVASPSREARIAQPARPPRVVATATRKRIAS